MAETINYQNVLNALRQVIDPELGSDLVSLRMVRDISINESKVSLTLVLTTDACPLKDDLEQAAREAVLSLPGVDSVHVNVVAEPPSPEQQVQPKPALPFRHSIAIASGKGGVGKTTVAVNLAVALAKMGASVGLLDADIYGPNVPVMMGVDYLPSVDDGKIKPAEAYGVKLMSIGFLLKPGQPVIWRGPMLHTAISQFLNDVAWGPLDYVIIDLPPGTGDAQLSLAQLIPLTGGIIVTLPQRVSVEDASRGLAMFQELKVPILGVIENMSYLEMPDGSRLEIFGSGGGEWLAQHAGVPFLNSIPMDPQARIGGDEGKPIVAEHPESPVSQAITQIAAKLVETLPAESPLIRAESARRAGE